MAPWAEDPAALRFEGRMRHSPRLHAEVPGEAPELLEARARALVAALERQQVAVAVLPELVVSPAAVKALQAALRESLGRAEGSCVRLVVAGSGLSEERHDATGLAYNECVVLGAGGRVLWRQRKVNHYAMSCQNMEHYGLHPCIQPDRRDHVEDVQTGRVVELRDGRLGRLMVLICEDLAQAEPADVLLAGLGPEWVFTPVLDGELTVGRWIHQRAWPNADRFHTNTVVATSLVLPLRDTRARPDPGLPYAVGLCVSAQQARRVALLRVSLDDPQPRVATVDWRPTDWDSATIQVEPPA